MIEPAEVTLLSRLVAGMEILRERRWRAARAGDAAAAAAVAIDHLQGRVARTRLTDVILSNLVVLSHRGDATAGVVIAHALRAFGRHDPSLSRLACHWGSAPAFAVPADEPVSPGARAG